MHPRLLPILQRAFRDLRPRTPMPEFRAEFFPFVNINNTIRVRQDVVKVRVSDLLEGAPDEVLYAIAHILIAKLYRKPVDPALARRYRQHCGRRDLSAKAHLVRQVRGRKCIASPRGRVYDLEAIFEELNTRFFYGLLARPQLTWSRDHARNALGHYDPAHNAIVVSRVFGVTGAAPLPDSPTREGVSGRRIWNTGEYVPLGISIRIRSSDPTVA